MINKLNELSNEGYIATMPGNGKFKHLRVAQKLKKTEEFLNKFQKSTSI